MLQNMSEILMLLYTKCNSNTQLQIKLHYDKMYLCVIIIIKLKQ